MIGKLLTNLRHCDRKSQKNFLQETVPENKLISLEVVGNLDY